MFSLGYTTHKVSAVHKANVRGAHSTAITAVVADEYAIEPSEKIVSIDMGGRVVVWDTSMLIPTLE